MSITKTIAKNTVMLYVRQILVLVVSLLTVRVVLNVLGVEDYGVYTVIGGVIYLFSFLGGSMASATQRFFSFALGQRDFKRLKKTFIINLGIYIAIAVIVLILLETVGFWFVKHHLKLPESKVETAQWIYHFSVMTFVVMIITTPFTSMIIAHEDMQIYAYMSILEAGLKLCVVFLLVHIDFDKLKLYSILILAVSFINFLGYIIICTRRYQECQFKRFYWDRAIFRDVVGFTGWTLFGQITNVGRNEAVTILVNQYFNPVVVAARGIAVNITSQINLFSNNFNTGLYPPLIKSYAAGNRDEMFDLIFNGCRITFFLMWVFALPFYLEMDMILRTWLKNPPEYSVLFTRLALVESLILSVSLPITTAARAPGKMKGYELTLGMLQVVIFFGSWIAFLGGGGAASVFIVAIAVNVVMFVVRLILVRGLIALPLQPFLVKVLVPVLIVMLVSGSLSFIVQGVLPTGFIFSTINILVSIVSAAGSMYFFGFDEHMRQKFKTMFKNRVSKLMI